MGDELSSWLDLAVRVAKSAGGFLREARSGEVIVTSDEGRDLKLALDVESEDRIVSLLGNECDFPVLSEEMNIAWTPEVYNDYHWIVDPLDGTLNYFRDIPMCCVSIGLWRGDKPILGVIYDFNRDQLFSGIVGEGAWLNGTSIKVGDIDEPGKAVLCTGFPVSTDFSNKAIGQFLSFVRDYKKVRLFGTAALSLSYVASGRVDAYCENDIKIWDIAAGLAIVEAAGGNSYQTMSDKPNCLNVFSANGTLFRDYPPPVSPPFP